MNDITVIVPSRGRPGSVEALRDAFHDTMRLPRSYVIAMCDTDDPLLPEYLDLNVPVHVAPNRTMNEALNSMLPGEAAFSTVLGFMGDDHRPRTPGWDERVLWTMSEMGGTGIVYCNDLFQGPNLPTAVFMSSNIVAALGYMAPPCLKHMFLDNFWLDLGRAISGIAYLDDVVIEHMHPQAGKAEMDENYARVWPLMEHDERAYRAYQTTQFLADVEKVRAIA